MLPVQELIHRIRWDAKFGSGSFVVGILDHQRNALVQTPFHKIIFEEGNTFFSRWSQKGESGGAYPFTVFVKSPRTAK